MLTIDRILLLLTLAGLLASAVAFLACDNCGVAVAPFH
jgi:hypothetical protein